MPATNEIVSALGGIFSTQRALAANLGAVERPLRTRKTVKVDVPSDATSLVFGTGLEIDAIREDVLVGLDEAIRETTGAIEGLGVAGAFNTEIEGVLGRPGESSAISALIGSLGQAFSALAADPDRGADDLFLAANAVISRFGHLTGKIETLRGKADRQLGEAVGKAQALLTKIAALNGRLATAWTTGAQARSLDEDRSQALTQLSGFLDFRFFHRGDGALVVTTREGTPLVDGASPHLSFKAGTGAVDPAMTRAKGDLGGVCANGIDISAEIHEGRIFALLKVRDLALPNLQSQIDTLAQTMQARLNQVSNRALAASAAQGRYLGGRCFVEPAHQRISLGGGDTVVRLIGPSGEAVATAALGSLLRRHMRKKGADLIDSWPVVEIARGLDTWLAAFLGVAGDAPRFAVDPAGRFAVTLPDGWKLAFRDQRSVALISSLTGPAGAALRLVGPLAFSDGTGNLFQCPESVAPTDSLEAIAAKIGRIPGLEVGLVPRDEGVALRVASRQGTDLVAEPDVDGATVATGLDFLPDGPAEDVAVAFINARFSPTLTSRPFENAQVPLGCKGQLGLTDDRGGILSVGIEPDWSLAMIARAIGGAGGIGGLTTSLAMMGNRVALKLAVPAPARLGLSDPAADPEQASAQDALQFRPAPDQIVSGFANFLGLNDLFVATPPDAFDAKAPIGVFASTAAPGTARALALSPGSKENALADAGTLKSAAEVFTTPLNIAAAGGMARRSATLGDYAAAIVAAAFAEKTAASGHLIYRRALLDGLSSQRVGLEGIDFDREVQLLNGYRQAFHDATRVVSATDLLFKGLAA